MNLTLIVAVSENNIIGKDGQIPWHIPEDLKRFKELTVPHPVIMGRKTYESIPKKFKPLSERKNIVLSSTLEQSEGIYVARDVDQALKLTEERDSYVMGGEAVYSALLPFANKLEITRVKGSYDGNVFLPTIDWSNWALKSSTSGVSQKSGIGYVFETYEKSS